jgi:phosphoribosyl 1,2-cyclic phosphodiesterase/ActR/RegA family two-component response regulator
LIDQINAVWRKIIGLISPFESRPLPARFVKQSLVLFSRKWDIAFATMKTVLVIAGDQAFRRRLTPALAENGWSVLDASDRQCALALAGEHQLELIVCDWEAPWADIALSCCGLAGQKENSTRRPVLIAAGDGPVAERMAALESGVDEYVTKPVDFHSLGKVLARFSANGSDKVESKSNGGLGGSDTLVKFWGVRGSIAAPGPETVYYGGNTSCVEVRSGSDIIVLDAGTGIRKLGLALVEEFKDRPIRLNVLLTHSHWDHIQGFPFFPPAYNLNNEVTICGFEGARQGLQSTLSTQMENPYFPISMQQMPGAITIRELKELSFKVGGIDVKAHFVNHPGICAGYRLFTPGGSISYLPDVELFQQLRTRTKTEGDSQKRKELETVPEEDRNLLEFIRDTDVLIIDSQYDAAEYDRHIGWGHSCFEDGVTLAMQGGVRRLFLFHHDPDHTDDQVSRMVARAREMVQRRHSTLIVEAAREGCEVVLPAVGATV